MTALYYEEKECYQKKLNEVLSEVADDLDDIVNIAFGVRKKTYLKDDVVPLIKKHMDTGLDKLALLQK